MPAALFDVFGTLLDVYSVTRRAEEIFAGQGEQLARLFASLARVMKPGAIFGSYEWCLTPRYDPGDPEHRAIKADIEAGDALPDLVPFDVVLDALDRAGLEVLEHRDLAPECDPETPWYEPLAGRWSLAGFRHTRAGRAATNLALRALETVRIAPRGSAAVSTFLNRAADALVRGGQTGIFTPMFYVLLQRVSEGQWPFRREKPAEASALAAVLPLYFY